MLRGLSPVTASLLRQLLRGIDQLRNEACQQEARRHLVVAQMCDLLLDPDLDIAELARMMGIARPTLSAVIAGARPPSDSVLNIMEATVMEFSPYRVHMRS